MKTSPPTRVLLLCLFALHLVLGASMGLSVDEAHYLLYARHPAWSYFDHPPMVGWAQWPLVALDAPVVLLRLIPGVLWLATVWGVHQLALRLQELRGCDESSAWVGFWAVLVLAVAPLMHVLGIGLLPDTLLMALTVALMWQTLTLMDAEAVKKPFPWLVLGLVLGCAGLSKYTAILIAFAVALCLLAAHGWRLLQNSWLWASVGIALLMVLPVVFWNADNHWVSFTYQAKHGAGSTWRAVDVLRFLIVQLLAFGPLLFVGAVGWLGLARQGNIGGRDVPDARWLIAFFVIYFSVLAALSGGGSSLPHWTAPAWVALAPFAGMGLARLVRTGLRRWLWLLVALQSLACTALLAMMVTAGQPFIPADSADVATTPNPFADLHGWDAAGARAQALATQHQLGSVAVQNWTLASRLGWYARPLPVLVLEDRFDQFDIWSGDLPQGASTLLVDWSHMPYTVPLGAHGFADCQLLDSQVAQRLGVPIASFRFYACHGWSGKPQPELKRPPEAVPRDNE